MTIDNKNFDFTVKLLNTGVYYTISIDPHELTSDTVFITRYYTDAVRYFNALLGNYNPDYFLVVEKEYKEKGEITATLRSQGYFRETS